jgi:hypothetical protein
VCSAIAPPWEAGQDEARRGHAPRLLAGDQGLDVPLRGPQAGLVLAPGAGVVAHVVPGAHHHAAVDRHRLHRGVGEHEADGQARR